MQQSSRTCFLVDHSSQVIEYVCVFPHCQLSRFLCSKCLLGNIHQHYKPDNSHIINSRDFQDKLKNDLIQAKDRKLQSKYDIKKLINPLKQLISEIQNLFKNVQNITQQVEQDKLQNININHLENYLQNIEKYGFDQIDDQSLNDLINIPEYQIDLSIYKQFEAQANLIIQNASEIKQWRWQQANNQKSLSQKIKEAQCQIQQIDDTGDKQIFTGAISNDLKYIVSGGDNHLLKIWDYQSNKLIKSIKLKYSVYICKFTEDSTILYAGSYKYIYQFDVKNQFKELHKQELDKEESNVNSIYALYCISNSIILTTTNDNLIIKTDVNKKQQLVKIKAHNNSIYGLDYNQNQNIIASGSNDQTIKLWNGNDGSLIFEKFNAHNNDLGIMQVLFIINNDQLISLDVANNLIIWNVNSQTKQIKLLKFLDNSGFNISLVLQQQYIIATGIKFIKVYSIKGELIRQFDHEVDNITQFSTIQHYSMKAVLILGKQKQQVCKLEMD